MISRVPLRSAVLGAALLILTLPMAADAGAANTTTSLGPIDKHKRAVYFELSGIAPNRIQGADAQLKPNRRKLRRIVKRRFDERSARRAAKRRMKSRLTRSLPTASVRDAADSGEALEVRKPRWTKGGRLRLEISEATVAGGKGNGKAPPKDEKGPRGQGKGKGGGGSSTDGDANTDDGSGTEEATGDGTTTDDGSTGDGTTTDDGSGSGTEDGTTTGDGSGGGDGATTDDGSTADEGTATDDGCSLALARFSATGCESLFEDTGKVADASQLWGPLSCESDERHQRVQGGADASPTAQGIEQGDDYFRRLTVFDGDDYWGERCELGENNRRTGATALYGEGQRRITFVTLRLPTSWPLQDPNWQTVLQMKQTAPADGKSGGPALEMQARSGKWIFMNEWDEVWETPASNGQWTRFAFDITYSAEEAQGRIKIYADLNGDGDANDAGEQSPTIERSTLKTEIPDPEGESQDTDGLAAGDPIPSHLRLGIYHNPILPCPVEGGGCSAEFDNLQVVGA